MAIIRDVEKVKALLRTAKTVAVLGAHTNESKAAYYVPRYLDAHNYEVYPVNPVFSGQTLFGKEVKETLAALDVPIDVVDVFRRSEAVAEHVDDILAMTPLPGAVWLQQGIKNDAVAKQLSDAGIDVVQDRCMLADHQYLL